MPETIIATLFAKKLKSVALAAGTPFCIVAATVGGMYGAAHETIAFGRRAYGLPDCPSTAPSLVRSRSGGSLTWRDASPEQNFNFAYCMDSARLANTGKPVPSRAVYASALLEQNPDGRFLTGNDPHFRSSEPFRVYASQLAGARAPSALDEGIGVPASRLRAAIGAPTSLDSALAADSLYRR